MKLATIEARSYALLSYTCAVDHDGFDVILDDRDHLKKIQLKASGRWTNTASWDIHRNIIRPTALNMEQLGFEASGNWGVEGGIILIDFDIDEEKNLFDVQYWFADIYTITAVALKMLPRDKKSVNAATNLRENLIDKGSNEKISVAKGLFVRAKNAHHLLALIGLHNDVTAGDWRFNVIRASSGTWEPGTQVTQEETASLITDFVNRMTPVCGHDKP